MLDIALALRKRNEGILYLISLISVHVYRYELDTLEGTKSLKPQIAKFSMNSIPSTTLLRDIMFLDSTDLIVVASGNGTSPLPSYRTNPQITNRMDMWHE